MKKNSLLLFVVAILFLSGCSIVNGVKSAYELTKCNFDYKSISDINIADVKLSDGLSVTNIANLTKFLLSDFTSLPIDMVVNLNVSNPSDKTASIHGCDYTINIDGLDVAEGNLESPLEVEAGKTGVMALRVKTDLKSVMTAENRSTIVSIVKNLAGISSEKSKINMKLNPYFKSNSRVVSSIAIPVSFEYNGKQSK
ncbi:MAG: LEA type 2 family protein [Bacteroidales bacterium]|nr:hypothetical protein [Bacteroidales bacterium]MDD5974763.1 LEA type 2 family protein [Bacteroidales bacterium]MDY5194470.1 LEA type 2 family protein [Candidatus Aphodosoma sp.]